MGPSHQVGGLNVSPGLAAGISVVRLVLPLSLRTLDRGGLRGGIPHLLYWPHVVGGLEVICEGLWSFPHKRLDLRSWKVRLRGEALLICSLFGIFRILSASLFGIIIYPSHLAQLYDTTRGFEKRL